MKGQEIKRLVEMGSVKQVRALLHVQDYAADYTGAEWALQFWFTSKVVTHTYLETVRGELRKFKTLDAVQKFLSEIGVLEFQVVSPLPKLPEAAVDYDQLSFLTDANTIE